MGKIYFLDTTLRDGEQAPGVDFLAEEKTELARALSMAGISGIEAGIPAMGKEEKSAIQNVLELGLPCEVFTWNRLSIKDLDASLDCGAQVVHVSAPVSEILLHSKLGKDRAWLFYQLELVLNYAVKHHLKVSVGAEDASRCDTGHLLDFFLLAQELGAFRVRYADTLGLLSPLQVYHTLHPLVDGLDIPLEFHGHNDFGMATANSLCAVQAGVKYISTSVNGLGERAGNTPLEEIAAVLQFQEGIDTGLDFNHLYHLSLMVEGMSGYWQSKNKPWVGEMVFSHESGIHVDGLLKDPLTYETVAPSTWGRERRLMIGKHSGISAIRFRAREWGIELDEDSAREIVILLRGYYAHNKGLNGDVYLRHILDKYFNKEGIK